MLKHRLIPCVLLKDWQLVKSVQFGSFRTIGHPTATVRVYNARNVDELIVLDIDASLKGEPINTEIISDMANECFMPLTIGGGIKTIDDVYAVLGAGADKISINSQAIKNPSFIKEIATILVLNVSSVRLISKKWMENIGFLTKKRGCLTSTL